MVDLGKKFVKYADQPWFNEAITSLKLFIDGKQELAFPFTVPKDLSERAVEKNFILDVGFFLFSLAVKHKEPESFILTAYKLLSHDLTTLFYLPYHMHLFALNYVSKNDKKDILKYIFYNLDFSLLCDSWGTRDYSNFRQLLFDNNDNIPYKELKLLVNSIKEKDFSNVDFLRMFVKNKPFIYKDLFAELIFDSEEQIKILKSEYAKGNDLYEYYLLMLKFKDFAKYKKEIKSESLSFSDLEYLKKQFFSKELNPFKRLHFFDLYIEHESNPEWLRENLSRLKHLPSSLVFYDDYLKSGLSGMLPGENLAGPSWYIKLYEYGIARILGKNVTYPVHPAFTVKRDPKAISKKLSKLKKS